MTKQIVLFIFTVLLLGLFASASPLPIPRDATAAAKRELKQFKLRRGDPEPFVRRADAAKPSSTYVFLLVPFHYTAILGTYLNVHSPYKRDEASAPQPSKLAHLKYRRLNYPSY
jgi:hypothetical protein